MRVSVLVLIRHGQSQWNLENRFTGWTDVPLTERGRADAEKAGKVLLNRGTTFARGYTARLQRASETLHIILHVLGQENIPVLEDSALNERHYGDLQGLNKAEIAAKYGQEKITLWRRSYATRPPGGESIEDCERRMLPFFLYEILPHVHAGENILVAASGNSMRPMIKWLDKLSAEDAASMEIGLCTPYIYAFEGKELRSREILEVPGIVTLGASQTQGRVEEGRVERHHGV